jgi:hypothetical protein
MLKQQQQKVACNDFLKQQCNKSDCWGSHALALSDLSKEARKRVQSALDEILTSEKVDLISSKILECLENGVPFSDVWKQVHRSLPAIAGTRSVTQLMFNYDVHAYSRCSCKSWLDWYNPILTEEWFRGDLQTLLEEEMWRVDIYWRALDRYEEIYAYELNPHFHTVRFSFSKFDSSVRCTVYSNLAGDHEKTIFVPPKLSKKDPTSQVAKLLSLWKGPKNSESVFYSDIKELQETDWSSNEVIVFVPRPWIPKTHKLFSFQKKEEIFAFMCINVRLGKKLTRDVLHYLFKFLVSGEKLAAVFRGHRYRLYGCIGKPSPAQFSPSAEQDAFWSGLDNLCRMGSVKQFKEYGNNCEAGEELKHGLYKCVFKCDYSIRLPGIQPIYFRE